MRVMTKLYFVQKIEQCDCVNRRSITSFARSPPKTGIKLVSIHILPFNHNLKNTLRNTLTSIFSLTEPPKRAFLGSFKLSTTDWPLITMDFSCFTTWTHSISISTVPMSISNFINFKDWRPRKNSTTFCFWLKKSCAAPFAYLLFLSPSGGCIGLLWVNVWRGWLFISKQSFRRPPPAFLLWAVRWLDWVTSSHPTARFNYLQSIEDITLLKIN